MAVIENQQTSLFGFISINGTGLTVGGQTISINEVINSSDIEMASGNIRRFYRQNKRTITVNYTYLPSSSEKTVDGREGRDFIYNLALNSPSVTVSYKSEPTGSDIQFSGFIESYNESIIRRDIKNQCIYYEVSFEVLES